MKCFGKRWFYDLFCLLSGVVSALPLVFSWMAPMAFVLLAPWLVAETEIWNHTERKPALAAYRHGLLFFYGYGLVTFHWFYALYPMDFIGLNEKESVAIVLLAILGLPLLQAVFSAFLPLTVRGLTRCSGMPREAALLLLALLWPFTEYLTAQTWAAAPWARLALTQAAFPALLQSVSLFGSYFLAFWIVLINALLGIAWIRWREGKTGPALRFLALALALFSLNLGYGMIRMAVPEERGEGTVRVAAVQPNISSKDKWDTASFSRNNERLFSMTEEAADQGADLVIWPESAFPFTLESYPSQRQRVRSMCISKQIDLLFGALKTEGDNHYNAMFLCDRHGTIPETFYAKRHMVPFGEYVPARETLVSLIPDLEHVFPSSSNYVPGDDTAVFDCSGVQVGTYLCFDSVFDFIARESVRDGAQFLVVATNDSWFGTSAAIEQHKFHDVLRAVENGRYVIRSGNTGISAVITSRGEILDTLGAEETGWLIGEAVVHSDRTLYNRMGNAILWVFLGGAAALPVFFWIRGRRRHEI